MQVCKGTCTFTYLHLHCIQYKCKYVSVQCGTRARVLVKRPPSSVLMRCTLLPAANTIINSAFLNIIIIILPYIIIIILINFIIIVILPIIIIIILINISVVNILHKIGIIVLTTDVTDGHFHNVPRTNNQQ